MRFNRRARLDTSQIRDTRGQRSTGGMRSGGIGGIPGGLPAGGGVVGLVITIVIIVISSRIDADTNACSKIEAVRYSFGKVD